MWSARSRLSFAGLGSFVPRLSASTHGFRVTRPVCRRRCTADDQCWSGTWDHPMCFQCTVATEVCLVDALRPRSRKPSDGSTQNQLEASRLTFPTRACGRPPPPPSQNGWTVFVVGAPPPCISLAVSQPAFPIADLQPGHRTLSHKMLAGSPRQLPRFRLARVDLGRRSPDGDSVTVASEHRSYQIAAAHISSI